MSAKTVTPYLTIDGADAAIAFYKEAFGAAETGRMMADDGKRIMHASLTLGGGTVMLSDAFAEHGHPGPSGASPVAIALGCDSAEDVDRMHAAAVAKGGTSDMAPANAFWGEYFAMVSDPFGHRWMLSGPAKA